MEDSIEGGSYQAASFNETDLLIQHAERARVAAEVEQGIIILPPDYREQVEGQLASIKNGNKSLHVLHTWKDKRGRVHHHVPVFGQIVLLKMNDGYYLYECVTKKRMSEHIKTLSVDDLYRLCIHFNLLTIWKDLDQLPQSEQKGVLWCMTELLWSMDQHGTLDWMAKMQYNVGQVAASCKALNNEV